MNIAISYFEGDSIPELDQFIDNLYLQKDVGYAIVIGDELDLYQNEKYAFSALGHDLSIVGKEWELPDKEINPDALCREVAVSWIMPPLLYSDQKKLLPLEYPRSTAEHGLLLG